MSLIVYYAERWIMMIIGTGIDGILEKVVAYSHNHYQNPIYPFLKWNVNIQN